MNPRPAEPSRQLIPAPPEAALAALERVAPDWDAALSAGPDHHSRRVELPVLAGIRHGWVRGLVAAQPGPEAGGCSLELTVEESHYRLVIPAAGLLVCGAGGGLVAMAWPFVPGLMPIAPYGALLAVAVWFLVLRRLRSEGVPEFLAAVAEEVRDPLPDSPPAQDLGRE